ncbi:MAG: hypothetical protein K2G19_01480 [Lachnospiraceae bacterium]|nr:hypothetical protein [Lachnospiraceae bacterium]
MSLGIGSNSNVRKVVIKNRDGSVAGTMTISKRSKKKQKKLQYNFKQLSLQIMQTKTPVNAKQVVIRARAKAVDLRKKLSSEDYDFSEVRRALIHAEKMTRIAKKRMKNLQQEENLEKKNGKNQIEGEDDTSLQEGEDCYNMKESEMSDKEMKDIMRELQETIRELEKEITQMEKLDELSDEMLNVSSREMEPEDIERLKKKHRSDELREIMEADMKYLSPLP